jgi:hypothetical protein
MFASLAQFNIVEDREADRQAPPDYVGFGEVSLFDVYDNPSNSTD